MPISSAIRARPAASNCASSVAIHARCAAISLSWRRVRSSSTRADASLAASASLAVVVATCASRSRRSVLRISAACSSCHRPRASDLPRCASSTSRRSPVPASRARWTSSLSRASVISHCSARRSSSTSLSRLAASAMATPCCSICTRSCSRSAPNEACSVATSHSSTALAAALRSCSSRMAVSAASVRRSASTIAALTVSTSRAMWSCASWLSRAPCSAASRCASSRLNSPMTLVSTPVISASVRRTIPVRRSSSTHSAAMSLAPAATLCFHSLSSPVSAVMAALCSSRRVSSSDVAANRAASLSWSLHSSVAMRPADSAPTSTPAASLSLCACSTLAFHRVRAPSSLSCVSSSCRFVSAS
mmetsp:Transcript_543/g.1068  ORF Transcript_543/g.1068 Transcript_543/m.1068 type:complete len:362 (+) Transcript_543:39-1124(+)